MKKNSDFEQKKQKQKQKNYMDKDKDRERGSYRKQPHLKDETLQSILSIILFLFAILFLLASIGRDGLAGPVGTNIYTFFEKLFGVGYFLIPLLHF